MPKWENGDPFNFFLYYFQLSNSVVLSYYCVSFCTMMEIASSEDILKKSDRRYVNHHLKTTNTTIQVPREIVDNSIPSDIDRTPIEILRKRSR
jgi:hypothetical protein